MMVPTVVALIATACGNQEPASGVGVPGGDPVRTTLTRPSPDSSPDSSTSVPDSTPPTTTTTLAPATTTPTTTIAVVATTVPATPTTSVPPSTAPAATTTTTEFVYVAEPAEGTLRAGFEGPRSLQLQRDLIALGFLPAGADDGQYGPGTAGGVRRFQDANSLVIDGVAGPITQAAVAQAIAELPQPT